MASDARYYIDLILRARDDTATAFASAAGNQELLNEKMQEGEERARSQRDAFLESSQQIVRSQREVREAMDEVDAASVRILQAQRRVEQQARQTAATEANHTATIRDQIKAHNDLNAAVKTLYETERDHLRDQKARELGFKSLNDAQQRMNELRKTGNAELAREIQQQINLDAATRRTLQTKAEDLRTEALRHRQLEQQEVVLKRLESAAQKYSKAFDVRQVSEYRKEIEKQADSLTRLGYSADKLDKVLAQVWDTRRVEQFSLAEQRAMKQAESNLRAYAAQVDRVAQLQRRREIAAAGGADLGGLRELDREIERSRTKLGELAALVKVVAAEDIEIGVDLDTGAAIVNSQLLEAVKTRLGRDVHINVDLDVAAAMAKAEALEHVTRRGLRGRDDDISWWGRFKEEVEGASNRVATFDNFLRGLFSLGIAVFFNQLIVLAGGAAGALTALAGSAIYAGGALGGALVAGIAQAIPALGVLATAIGRVKSVMEAVQQNQLMQQQLFQREERDANATASANDALADAHRRVRDAQTELTRARAEARRELDALILAEREAELAARGATLTQQEAQQSLRAAMSAGRTGDIARGRLRTAEADVGVDRARLRLSNTRDELSTFREEGSPNVARAAKQLEDAERAARRAQRSAEQAGEASLASAGKLQYLLNQMSGAERRLYEAINRLSDRWRKFSQEVSEPLINSFSRAVNRVVGLLSDNRIVGAMRRLSGEMSKQFDRFFDAITGDRGVKLFVRFANQARRNLGPLMDIALNLGKAFANIADAAGPSLNRLLRYFARITSNLAEWTSSKRGRNALAEFFEEGVKQVRAFMRLGGAVFQLIGSIINPKVGGGAGTGRKILGDMTDAVQALNRAARSKEGREFLQQFFENSRQVMKELRPILVALAEQFARLFNEEGIKNFRAAARLISEVLIPAFGDFLHIMGLLMRAVGLLLDIPLVPELLRWIVAAGALAAVLGKIHVIFTPFLAFMRVLGPVVAGAGARIVAMGAMLTRLGAVFSTIGALGSRFLTPIGAIFGRIGLIVTRFGTFIVGLAPKIAMAVRLMFGPWGLVVAGVIAGIIALEKKFGIFSAAFEWIKEAFRDVIDWILDFLGISSPAQVFIDIGEAIVDGITWPFRALYNLLRRPISRAIEWVKEALRDARRWIRNAWDDVTGFLVRPFRQAWNTIEDVWRWIKNAVRDGAEFVLDKIDWLADRIKGGLDKVADIGKSIGNTLGEGFKAGINLMIDAINWGIEQINKILRPRDLGPLGSTPDLRLPTIPNFATGGYIDGNYAEGDIYPVMVAGDEAILNPRHIDMLGRRRVMEVLRRTGAPVIGRGRRGYQTGGSPAPVDPSMSADNQALIVDLGLALTIIQQFGRRATEEWNEVWNALAGRARRGSNQINNIFSDTFDHVDRWQERIGRRVTSSWDEIVSDVTDSTGRLRRQVGTTMDSLAEAVYTGMRYIGRTTNSVLRSFDADPVRLEVQPPDGSGSRAAQGYLGMPGERGGDAIPILVGRGEAVLNWAHQKMIEPALRAFYGFGLGDLFNRTSAFHAGGPQHMGGYAKGGFTGPFGSGSAFTAIANFARKKFNLTMTSGRSNHSQYTSSGNVSDHFYGLAGDFSNGSSPTPQMDAFSGFWKNRLPSAVKQLIWRNKDQFNGYPIGGHMDHVHLAVQRALAFDAPRMAKLISRAMRGLNVNDLLRNLTGDAASVEHIDALKARGPKGPLLTLLQRILNVTRRKANSYLDSSFMSGDPRAAFGPNDATNFSGPWTSVMRQIARARGWSLSAWQRLVEKESGGNPAAVNPSSGAFGLGQFLGATARAYAPFGALSKDGSKQIQAMARYISDRYGSPTQALAFHNANNWYRRGGFAPRFATGGFVGGVRRAAEGYWGDDENLARIRRIRRSGVYRAPEIGIAEDALARVVEEFRLAAREIGERVGRMRKLSARTTTIVKNLTEITREGGLLDGIATGIEQFTERIARRLGRDRFRIERGTVIAELSDEDVLERELDNMRATFRKLRANRQRLSRILRRTNEQLRTVNRRIDQLEDIEDPTRGQRQELERLRRQRGNLVTGRRNLRARIREQQDSLNEALEALFEAQLNKFKEGIDANLAEARASGGQNLREIELATRRATALGSGTDVAALGGQRLEILRRQREILQEAATQATARGYGDLAQQYREQFDELGVTIEEAVAQQLQAAIDAINNAAARALAEGERRRGMADLLQTVGGNTGLLGQINSALGANFQLGDPNAIRRDTLQADRAALEAQRRELQVLLRDAGPNIGAIETLTDQLADLDKTIAENIVAQHELNTTIRQQAIDAILARQQFQGGVFGNLLSYVQALAARDPAGIGGYTQEQQQLLEQQAATITQALQGVTQQLLEGFGIDLSGLTGMDLVNALQSLNYDGITAGLTETDRTQFESLINSIIQLATDLESNTGALEQLNGNLEPQSWSGTAWQWFREAIFTGMGEVLPQYTIPSFDGGGPVARGGLARLHTGEYVAEKGDASRLPIKEGDTNINVYEAGRPIDVTHLAARLKFEKKRR